MKIKDLKKLIANLPNEMVVTAIDPKGVTRNAMVYVDGAGEEDDYSGEWLVITVPHEPLFVMPVPCMRGTLHYYLKDNGDISFKQGNAYKFNGDQIDKYFPDIKELAVPVDQEPKLPQEIEVSEYLEGEAE